MVLVPTPRNSSQNYIQQNFSLWTPHYCGHPTTVYTFLPGRLIFPICVLCGPWPHLVSLVWTPCYCGHILCGPQLSTLARNYCITLTLGADRKALVGLRGGSQIPLSLTLYAPSAFLSAHNVNLEPDCHAGQVKPATQDLNQPCRRDTAFLLGNKVTVLKTGHAHLVQVG